jgi:hypothetical protein
MHRDSFVNQSALELVALAKRWSESTLPPSGQLSPLAQTPSIGLHLYQYRDMPYSGVTLPKRVEAAL